MNDAVALYGQIACGDDPGFLVEGLSAAGLPVACRESAHYEGGRYIRIETERFLVTLERIAPEEYLIGGEADGLDELHDAAEALSETLNCLALRHRLEVYDGVRLVAYFHHGWPMGDAM